MGIKGIYAEIGPGERIALAKLAVEKLEESSRPMRIGIDISIWQFQIQSGRGGSNPAIRTLYYRLLRLLSLPIRPLFVFDGPHKPSLKRNKQTKFNCNSVSDRLVKDLLKLFGFPFHLAPGEAEAECAALQREGIVDAVLSEDVDTLMFGSRLTIRDWSSESSRGNHAPTHVSIHSLTRIEQEKSGLNREGMILVAMMSGGDYITGGLPGCGIKVACEAARAGFGESLCRLSNTGREGIASWRESLAHEIRTNESRYFKVKHKVLTIPDTFPNMEVLAFYTNPAVSSESTIRKLKQEIIWDTDVDIKGLRSFVSDVFEWKDRSGAIKFIRGLAPALLISKLIGRGNRQASGYGDIVLTAMNEMELVRDICGKRFHFSTDGLPELRLSYCPLEIVGLDLECEAHVTEESGNAMMKSCEDEESAAFYQLDDLSEGKSTPCSPFKKGHSMKDPSEIEKIWVLETIVKLGVPLKAKDFEASLRAPKKQIVTKSRSTKASKTGGMPKGALDRYVTTSKPGVNKLKGKVSPVPSRESNPPNAENIDNQMQMPVSTPSANVLRNRREHHKVLDFPKSAVGKTIEKDSHAIPETQLESLGSRIRSNPLSSYLQPRSNFEGRAPSELVVPKARIYNKQSRDGLFEHSETTTSSQPLHIHPSILSTATITCELPPESPDTSLPELEAIFFSTADSEHPSPLEVPDCSSELSDGIEETTHDNKRGCRLNSPQSVNDRFGAPPADGYLGRGIKGGGPQDKRYIMPRESLQGSWKEVTETERDLAIGSMSQAGRAKGKNPKAWRRSEIEIVDLTHVDIMYP